MTAIVDGHYPKGLLCSAYLSGRKLAEFSIRLKNLLRALAEVSKSLTKKGVKILSGLHTLFSIQVVRLFKQFAYVHSLEACVVTS